MALQQRSVPLQSATKSATNRGFPEDWENATARVSTTYDTRAASEAERMGIFTEVFRASLRHPGRMAPACES